MYQKLYELLENRFDLFCTDEMSKNYCDLVSVYDEGKSSRDVYFLSTELWCSYRCCSYVFILLNFPSLNLTKIIFYTSYSKLKLELCFIIIYYDLS